MMLYSIQFLRFIAAFSVVVHHAITEYNEIHFNVLAAGVDIFFVISGFVISIATRPGETVKDFLLKRVIRIFPMYWLGTVFLMCFQFVYWHKTASQGELWRSVFLFPIIGTNWSPIYGPGWTLVYECAFYVLFAFSLLFFKAQFRLLCGFILLFLASGLFEIPSIINKSPSYTYLHTDLLIEFVFGMLIAQLLPLIRAIRPLQALGILACSLAIYAHNWGIWNAARGWSWGIPSALLVIAALAFEPLPFLRSRLAVRLGAASYSIYMTHLTASPLVVLFLSDHGLPVRQPPLLQVAVGVAGSVLFGVAVNLFVEEPVLHLLRRAFLPQKERHGSESTTDVLPTLSVKNAVSN